MKNESSQPARAIFATGMRYDAPNNTGAQHGDNRFDRPREGKFPGDYRQLGETFSQDWVYGFTDDGFLRDGRLLYTFPAGYSAAALLFTGNTTTRRTSASHRNLAQAPPFQSASSRIRSCSSPEKSTVLDFKMPVVPSSDPASIAAIEQAGFDRFEADAIKFWSGMLARGHADRPSRSRSLWTRSYANLVYDLIARDHIGNDYIQTVNKLHYHEFYLRDGADIVHSYDVTGYPEIARQDLEFFSKSQKPDGNFLSQDQQYDGWGEAVWAYSQHYRITHDKAFAEWALPQLARSVAWLKKARASDPLHIMPASDVRDNEYVPGHLTGYNFLALSGLKLAIEMAGDTGHADLAAKLAARIRRLPPGFLQSAGRSEPARTTAISLPLSTARKAALTGATCSLSSPNRLSSRTIRW